MAISNRPRRDLKNIILQVGLFDLFKSVYILFLKIYHYYCRELNSAHFDTKYCIH